jgi:hypothetical protein
MLNNRIDIGGMGTRVADGLEQGFLGGLAHGLPQSLLTTRPLKLGQLLSDVNNYIDRRRLLLLLLLIRRF